MDINILDLIILITDNIMNRTGIDTKTWTIVYSPKETDDVLLIEETEEQIKKMSYSEVVELIKKYINKLIK